MKIREKDCWCCFTVWVYKESHVYCWHHLLFALKARKSNIVLRAWSSATNIVLMRVHGLKGKLLRRGDFPSLKLYDIYFSIEIKPVHFLAYHHYFQIRDIINKYLNLDNRFVGFINTCSIPSCVSNSDLCYSYFIRSITKRYHLNVG